MEGGPNLRLIATNDHDSSFGMRSGLMQCFEKLSRMIRGGHFSTLSHPWTFVEAINDEDAIRDHINDPREYVESVVPSGDATILNFPSFTGDSEGVSFLWLDLRYPRSNHDVRVISVLGVG